MPTADSVTTANSILNKGRKPPRVGLASAAGAQAILEKSQQPTTSPNPGVNMATELPDTNPPDTTMPITNLVDIFERTLAGG